MPAAQEEISEVARNAIWTEHCKREGRSVNLDSLAFGGIRSPKKMGERCIPEKPNNVAPLSRPQPADIDHAKAVLAGMSITQHEGVSPEQMYTLPITGNQEYGFFHMPLLAQPKMFQHPKGGCDVTNFADAYVTMTGTSPYKRPPQQA